MHSEDVDGVLQGHGRLRAMRTTSFLFAKVMDSGSMRIHNVIGRVPRSESAGCAPFGEVANFKDE
jgi:hypothetical protein